MLHTVLCSTLNGNENGFVLSDEYKSVSFSAPSIIASSKRIAEKYFVIYLQKKSLILMLPRG